MRWVENITVVLLTGEQDVKTHSGPFHPLFSSVNEIFFSSKLKKKGQLKVFINKGSASCFSQKNVQSKWWHSFLWWYTLPSSDSSSFLSATSSMPSSREEDTSASLLTDVQRHTPGGHQGSVLKHCSEHIRRSSSWVDVSVQKGS